MKETPAYGVPVLVMRGTTERLERIEKDRNAGKKKYIILECNKF